MKLAEANVELGIVYQLGKSLCNHTHEKQMIVSEYTDFG